jgi:phenylalanyl-tRNA synthetase beta chain
MIELREELLRIARTLTAQGNDLSEDVYDALVEKWAALCPHPGETDILFWPNELGLCREDEIATFRMPPEDMVQFALSWEPRTVAMRVTERSGGRLAGHHVYQLEAPGTPRTQVAAALEDGYEQGEVVAVALKGSMLDDGTFVETSYEHGVASFGKIIGRTDQPVGTILSLRST